MLKEMIIRRIAQTVISLVASGIIIVSPMDIYPNNVLVDIPVDVETPVVTTELSANVTAGVTKTMCKNEVPHVSAGNQESDVYGVDVEDYIMYYLPSNPNYCGFKAYMAYQAITCIDSVQYALQQQAYTADGGFRQLDGRYMIAVGTGCNAPCGTYLDLILENGTEIPCIVGDIKADVDTEDTNTYTSYCWCASEFIIDNTCLDSSVMYAGNVSVWDESWDSKVVAYRIYDTVAEY